MIVDTAVLRPTLKQFEFKKLFNLLGWNKFDQTLPIEVGGHLYHLQGVAQQRGVQIFVCPPDAAGKIPAHGLRRKIDTELSKSAQEHLLIFADAKETTQVWQWLSREAGRTTVLRQQTYYTSTSGDALLQKLDHIAFPLSAEESLTLTGVVRQLKDAFDREKVTRTFYDRFKVEHDAFLNFIAHIPDTELQRWYASVMINRLMFLYFIQGKGFLDGKTDYLKSKMDGSQGHYYRDFLCPLFFDGLAKREAERPPAVKTLLGHVPYLNGGLFAKHQIEKQYGEKITIPNEAFERLYKFFQEFDWTLDERPIHSGKEINPDVLGYIFEKYINQKQMGAYYTKEDITEYIGKNTILLFLFDQTRRDCGTAFKSEHTVWELLAADPDAYIYSTVRHGTDLPLPKNIAQGVDNVAGRANWNQPAPPEYGLPTEIWRETVARRERYAAVRDKLASGSVQDINDFVTLNLNIRQFALDALTTWEGADLIRAFWDAIRHITILDPTCGSGAFLFAALEILKPLYEACLDRMGGFVADADQLGRTNDHKAFRETLKEVAKHPNRDYFVFKSIIVNNLYGVDIMEEATEICKLRLFLKLAAQVEPDTKKDNFGIEPLPDIDFNIRAGNTLVGFATEAQVKFAVLGREQLTMDMDDKWTLFEQRLKDAQRKFETFQELQNQLDLPSGLLTEAKDKLQSELGSLRDELDNHLAVQSVKLNSESKKAWRKDAQPFHWFVEFYKVMKSGGFNVLIGNPPYVSINKIDYSLPQAKGSKFSDIYAHVLIRSLALSGETSRLGMIVPMSLTFSEDFGKLRETLVNAGSNWLSSYDNIPAAVFAGVSQRCTIWIGSQAMQTPLHVAPMYRWRAEARPQLTQNVFYTEADTAGAAVGFPKIAMPNAAQIIIKMSEAASSSARGIVLGSKQNKKYIKFSPSARNFISAFLEPPPCLDTEDYMPVQSSDYGAVAMPDADTATAALAVLSGEYNFWYWLVFGDGFHVTGGNIGKCAAALNAVHDSYFDGIVSLGALLHERRLEALVFKKNAGKYVGNYNYRNMFPITRRVDLMFMASLGANRTQALSIFDYVQRVLSINESAGEKGIPVGVKALYAPPAVDIKKQKKLFAVADNLIAAHYGFTDEETDFIINHDIKYPMGRSGEDADVGE